MATELNFIIQLLCIDEKSVIGLTESDWQMTGPSKAIQRRQSCCENVKPILTLLAISDLQVNSDGTSEAPTHEPESVTFD